MMRLPLTLCSLIVLSSLIVASPYREDLVDYNLNVNQTAQSPLDYSSTRANTTYTSSPENWRALPAYTILMDKFSDGDLTNDFFETVCEFDYQETQFRFGGDLRGLVSRLYLNGVADLVAGEDLDHEELWEPNDLKISVYNTENGNYFFFTFRCIYADLYL
jgi:alpha-1,3-glucan synthase